MTAVLTPAGSSGAGAGWTPGRSRTSWPTARKQATSVLMAPTPACDPKTARAILDAAFAQFRANKDSLTKTIQDIENSPGDASQ